jgi:hypothetical protein
MEEKGKAGAAQFDTSRLSGRRMIDFNWITDKEILAGCSGDVTFTDHVEDGVRVNGVRSVCLSVPTLGGRHGVEAGFCKGTELVPP